MDDHPGRVDDALARLHPDDSTRRLQQHAPACGVYFMKFYIRLNSAVYALHMYNFIEQATPSLNVHLRQEMMASSIIRAILYYNLMHNNNCGRLDTSYQNAT
jgi:hypothetical protein